MNRSFLFLAMVFISINTSYSFGQTLTADLKNLSKESEVILTGKVTSQQSIWNEDHTRIYTKVTIKVDEYFKGASGNPNVIVKHLGGEVGEVGELYSHIPTFSKDEEVLLFLNKNKTGNDYNVYAGESGKVSLLIDKSTNEKTTADMQSISVVKQQILKYVKGE